VDSYVVDEAAPRQNNDRHQTMMLWL